MAAVPSAPTPTKLAALKPWLTFTRDELRWHVEQQRIDDQKDARAVAAVERHWAAHGEQLELLSEQCRDDRRQQQEVGADIAASAFGHLRQELHALHGILEGTSGMSAEAATIGAALSAWTNPTVQGSDPKTIQALRDALLVVETLLDDCEASEVGIGGLVEDPFSLGPRRAHLIATAEAIERAAYHLIQDAEIEIRSRGLANVGCHNPTVDKVFRLFDEIFDRTLEFDERAAQFRMRQFKRDGQCANPFNVANERQLIEFAAWKIQGLPSWIRSSPSGRVIWAVQDRHDEDLCRIHTDRLTKSIRSEYARRRVEFEMNCQSNDTSPPSGISTESVASAGSVLATGSTTPPADGVATANPAIVKAARPKNRRRKTKSVKIAPPEPRPLVELRGLTEKPLVCGKEVDRLTKPRYAVVEVLLKAGQDGLGKADLQNVKGDAIKYLRELRAASPLWKRAIRMAGGAWRGYAIVWK